MRDADRVIGLVEAAGLPSPRLILNRIRPELVRRGEMMTQDDVIDVLRRRPARHRARRRGDRDQHEPGRGGGERPAPRAPARPTTNIARRLLGEEVPFLMLDNGGGRLDRMLKRLGGGRPHR